MAKRTMILAVLAVILLNLTSVYAAKIYGTVYDMDLDIAKNIILKINTIPEQTYVSKDGAYSFMVPAGNYIITASFLQDYRKYTTEQSIRVKEQGDYVLDLILFPDISEEEDIINTEISIENPYEEINLILYAGILVIIFGVVAGLYYIRKKLKKKPEVKLEGDQTEDVIKFIKEQGGRVTQKDIRKKFPVSEAKISLIISELEHKGTIEKIKKGRGNIIILKQ